MPAILLTIAILAEVAGTVALKYTDGFTNLAMPRYAASQTSC